VVGGCAGDGRKAAAAAALMSKNVRRIWIIVWSGE